jgi:hypothetical protein
MLSSFFSDFLKSFFLPWAWSLAVKKSNNLDVLETVDFTALPGIFSQLTANHHFFKSIRLKGLVKCSEATFPSTSIFSLINAVTLKPPDLFADYPFPYRSAVDFFLDY